MHTIIIALAVITLMTGCSNRSIYETFRNNHRNDCLKLPDPEVEPCLAEASKTYEEYEKERKEK